MYRECPNCHKRGVFTLWVMLWSAKCKYCSATIGVDQFKATLIVGAIGMLLIAVAYVGFKKYGLVAIVAALLAHVVSLFVVEMLGPLVVRRRSRN